MCLVPEEEHQLQERITLVSLTTNKWFDDNTVSPTVPPVAYVFGYETPLGHRQDHMIPQTLGRTENFPFAFLEAWAADYLVLTTVGVRVAYVYSLMCEGV